MTEQGIEFDILQMRDHWTLEQKKRIDALDWNLKMFSYPPMRTSLVGQGKDASVVFEYAVGTGTIPLIADLIDGEQCIADITQANINFAPMDWDTHIIGSRADDSHPYLGKAVNKKEFEVGGVKFIAPLFEMTRDEVKAELDKRGIDTTEVPEHLDTGNLVGCTNCINGTGKVWCKKEGEYIDAMVWDREQRLQDLREYYG